MSGGPRPWKVGLRGGVMEAHVRRRAGTNTGPTQAPGAAGSFPATTCGSDPHYRCLITLILYL